MFLYASRSGQLQHVMLGQDLLSLCVHERQGVDDDVQDGRGLLLALHTHQLEEVPSFRESEEDQLCSPMEQPGVVGGQRHLVGVPEGRRYRETYHVILQYVVIQYIFWKIQLRRHL